MFSFAAVASAHTPFENKFQRYEQEYIYNLFIYLFIKKICVSNAQLMQKEQKRRFKTVAAIWTKKFSIPPETVKWESRSS